MSVLKKFIFEKKNHHHIKSFAVLLYICAWKKLFIWETDNSFFPCTVVDIEGNPYFDIQPTDLMDGSIKILDTKGKTIASCRKERFGPGKMANIIAKNGWTKKGEGKVTLQFTNPWLFSMSNTLIVLLRPCHDCSHPLPRIQQIWKQLPNFHSQRNI